MDANSLIARPHQIVPRPYQSQCVDRLWEYLHGETIGSPVAALPTGTGKSLIPPLFLNRLFQNYPMSRAIMLTHVKELVEQNRKALQRVMPTAPVGIYSAGLNRKEPGAPIVYGSIQSVRNAIKLIGKRDVMFVDEAHLISPSEGTMYQNVIAELRAMNPNMPVIGMSATPYRMRQGMLTDDTFDKDGNARKAMFDDIVFDLTGVSAFNSLIEKRYLSPLVPKETDVVIDVSDVRTLAGEFVQSDLHEIVKKQNITLQALRQAYDLLADRKSWIVFGAGIENCIQITEILNSMGVAACCVHSKMKSESRDNYIAAFKAGRFRAIVSNNILTTGFDHPQVDAIVDLRPTVSVVMHLQKYGRGTRPYFHPSYSFQQLMTLQNRIDAIAMGGKKNCKVLDFAGNTLRLGPINDPVLPKKRTKAGTGEIPIKLCPVCGAYNHTPSRFCIDEDCDHEFVLRSKIKPNASTAELIRKDEVAIEIWDVTLMQPYFYKGKGDKPDKVRLQYFCGIQPVTVWLGFGEGQTSFFKHNSHNWWRQHSPNDPPESIEEAIQRIRSGECRMTRQLKVNTSKKYPEVTEFLF